MKALVINETRSHYGFVIEVEQNRDGSYYDSVADLVYEAKELQFQWQQNPVDWSSFRREAAKDILPATINWRRVNEAGANILISKEEAAKLAIKYADELIKLLKQE